MSKDKPLRRFFELWAEISDLEACEEALGWDQETMMPPEGHHARGELLATVAGLRHRGLTSPELADTIREGLSCNGVDELLSLQLLEAQRECERATQVPEQLVQALAVAGSEGIARWREARRERDFALFARAPGRAAKRGGQDPSCR